LKRPMTLRSGESTNYGIAWRTTIQADDDVTLGHSGGSVGGTTLFITIPAHDMVVAGVVNVTGPAGAIVNRVAEIFERHLRGM
ncbi:MAG: serine hydrolase, partial [Gemmatimonadetes bacterium]|nr:serine hydrolase [Gemmatimonadota bacterium]